MPDSSDFNFNFLDSLGDDYVDDPGTAHWIHYDGPGPTDPNKAPPPPPPSPPPPESEGIVVDVFANKVGLWERFWNFVEGAFPATFGIEPDGNFVDALPFERAPGPFERAAPNRQPNPFPVSAKRSHPGRGPTLGRDFATADTPASSEDSLDSPDGSGESEFDESTSNEDNFGDSDTKAEPTGVGCLPGLSGLSWPFNRGPKFHYVDSPGKNRDRLPARGGVVPDPSGEGWRSNERFTDPESAAIDALNHIKEAHYDNPDASSWLGRPVEYVGEVREGFDGDSPYYYYEYREGGDQTGRHQFHEEDESVVGVFHTHGKPDPGSYPSARPQGKRDLVGEGFERFSPQDLRNAKILAKDWPQRPVPSYLGTASGAIRYIYVVPGGLAASERGEIYIGTVQEGEW